MCDEKEEFEYSGIKEKVVLLNIDSKYREIQPKNILKGLNIYPESLSVKKDSNILNIKFNNNNIKSGDKIIIKNVKTRYESISQALYFIQNYNYALIYLPNHNFDVNFEKYYTPNKIEISNIDYEKTHINNIPINSLITKHKIYLIESLVIPNNFLDNIEISYEDLKRDFIGIELLDFYVSYNVYDILPNLIDINRTEIGGIPIGYFNADFPVNFNQRQGNYLISSNSNTGVEVLLPLNAFRDETITGNILIDKIESEYEGYPDISSYTIKLRKNLTNVSQIEIVSSEIPNNFSNISNSNNKFYWQNLDDGKIEYMVSIPIGNYTIESLIKKLEELINLKERVSLETLDTYNIFRINFDSSSQEIIFKSYREDNLSNAIFIDKKVIDNQERNVLEIVHHGNNVDVGDIITISNSTAISYVPADIINKEHKVISVNRINNSYQVILPTFNQTELRGTIGSDTVGIDIRSAYPRDGAGGEEIKVLSKNISRILFNKSDSLGSILGFNDNGKSNAITKFSAIISNKDEYANEDGFNLNVVGNERNNTNYFNLTNDIRYLFLYINDYEEVITNTSAGNCFAKILVDVDGNNGNRLQGSSLEYMINSYVSYPIKFVSPISNLSQLQIKFTYPDGSLVNFGNINHSFTLKITEEIYKKIGKQNVDSKRVNIYRDTNNFTL